MSNVKVNIISTFAFHFCIGPEEILIWKMSLEFNSNVQVRFSCNLVYEIQKDMDI